MEYATAVEVFLEVFLRETLARRYGSEIADYILDKVWKVDFRFKELLKLATGHTHQEQRDIYNSWMKNVQEPRNKLAHGKDVLLDASALDRANQAVHEAIRWLQSLVGTQ